MRSSRASILLAFMVASVGAQEPTSIESWYCYELGVEEPAVGAVAAVEADKGWFQIRRPGEDIYFTGFEISDANRIWQMGDAKFIIDGENQGTYIDPGEDPDPIFVLRCEME